MARRGLTMALIYRGDYWQIAYLMPKGSDPRDGSLEAFKERIVAARPQLREHVDDLRSWDQTSQLDVRVDRLETWWRTGLLCIGDAAHAMSPIGGVGINLAVADAVAAANILCAPLRDGRLRDADLAKVQRRRELPARVIQAIQVFAQDRVIAPNLNGGDLSPIPIPAIVGRARCAPSRRSPSGAAFVPNTSAPRTCTPPNSFRRRRRYSDSGPPAAL